MRWSKRAELLIPLCFLLVSTAWILFSDAFFLHLARKVNSTELTRLQSIKGCFYVAAVTIGLYLLIRFFNQKINRSEASYKDLFLGSTTPLIIFDKVSLQILAASHSAAAMYGYSKEAFQQMRMSDLRCTYERREALSGPSSGISLHKKKDGTRLRCIENASAIIYQNKAACLLSINNITEIERARRETFNREQELHLVLNSITDGFFTLSKDLVVKRANKRFKQLVKVPVNKMEGKHLSVLFPSDTYAIAYEQYTKAIDTQQPVHFENLFDGDRWHRVSVYPYENGLSVFFKDITQEKLNEINNFQNQQNLLALINNTEDMMWSIDNHFRYYTYNEPYEHIYEIIFSEKLWVGKSALNANHGKDHIDKWHAIYQRALLGERFSIDMEFTVNQKYISAIGRFNPIYDANKTIIGVGCFLQNITERKLHERQIEQQSKQLRNIAFITSHKVRLPLTNILGLVEILDSDNPMSNANSEIINLIKNSAQQLDQNIRNMVEETAHSE